ncbi:helix-turn-helix domain-containing protein [Cellulophaga sp. L1A9]|uniref:helix-turn-helix domain-containing protein n=1 Tax=Cellulophaga sp. L1A9 TaxID=2686362 RepID=UPI00131C3B5E|nr:helix-turn-helix domain-containing protein [Cellulophaga sp. L1A9]
MKLLENKGYVKHTQKDYSVSFKLQIVAEIESGQLSRSEACHKYGIEAKLTIREWLRKYGNYDWENQSRITVSKAPEQKII